MNTERFAVSSASAALDILSGGVWHVTRPDRWARIKTDRAVKPEPNLPESERWGRPDAPGFVRSLGGVSLFDFRAFESVSYSERYPLSSWRTFVPYRADWGEAVWLLIDTQKIANRFVTGHALLARWREDGEGRRIMPEIEACCIGEVPLAAIERALHLVGA